MSSFLGSNCRRPLNYYCRMCTEVQSSPWWLISLIRHEHSLTAPVGSSLVDGYPFSPDARNGTKGTTTHVQAHHSTDPPTRRTRAHCPVPGAVTRICDACSGTPYSCTTCRVIST